MRPYDESILAEIKSELQFIWMCHNLHRLKGQMRVYTVEDGQFWKTDQPGYETWFGPDGVDELVEKLKLLYRKGVPPNSTLLLDPIVYTRNNGPVPTPVGSGVLWSTLLTPQFPFPGDAIARLQKERLFFSPLEHENNPRAGLKVLGMLSNPALPGKNFVFDHNGNYLPGIREICDFANIPVIGNTWMHYVLSGFEYRSMAGNLQHTNFRDIFGEVPMRNEEDIKKAALSVQRFVDVGITWNAYGRDQKMFDRYGADVSNLQRNLNSEEMRNREIQAIKRELAFMWNVQLLHGLRGKMRLYTHPTQDPWRSKQPGFNFFFGPDEIDAAAEQIRIYYNAGVLPNSPLLLDPMVYVPDTGANWVPLGTGMVWSTIFCVGREKLNESMKKRLRDMGALVAPINRGGHEDAGLKALVLLDQPIRPEPGKPLPGSFELYDVSGAQGKEYWSYYMLSGLEYLSSHGAFMHRRFDEMVEGMDLNNPESWRSRMVPIQRLLDGAKCWNQYDRHHSLWARFGIDVPNLERNLRYFNLCARDFELLDATNTLKAASEMEKFELVCQGWIPRSAVTLLAATGGTGKSSMAHALCVKAGIDYRPDEPKPLWLGSQINTEFCQGMCVYFTGEDGPAIVNARAEMFDPEGRSKRVMFFRTDFGLNDKGDPRTLAELLLKKLYKMPDVSVVVVDPARKYLTGDEDNAEVVSEFFEAIEEFAISKKCGMVVVHHLSKGAKPKSSAEVLDCLRGSQVFIDRPRVVIGMNRDGAYTLAGLSKNNIPPQLGMVQGDRVFVRDPDSLDLIWLPGPEGIRNAPVSHDELREIKKQIQGGTSGPTDDE
ncbi:MAG: hypothetical protein EB060_06615 [Proteobacteria bacterium]|nr:hypothetical protein [Pseudomonadota bacterium]